MRPKDMKEKVFDILTSISQLHSELANSASSNFDEWDDDLNLVESVYGAEIRSGIEAMIEDGHIEAANIMIREITRGKDGEV